MRQQPARALPAVGAPRGLAQPRRHRSFPRRWILMWPAPDLTTTITGEGAWLAAVSWPSQSHSLPAECVGIHARTPGHPLRGARADSARACGAALGGFAQGIAAWTLGAPRCTGASTCPTPSSRMPCSSLGIASSPAFVRAPEGNGCAERFIRTLKENLLVGALTFDTVEELRQALLVFRELYNTTLAHRSRARSSPHRPGGRATRTSAFNRGTRTA